MKLKVQRTDTAILVGGCMKSLEEAEESGLEILEEDGPSVFEMAMNILESFPRFKEVVINTELTGYGKVEY